MGATSTPQGLQDRGKFAGRAQAQAPKVGQAPHRFVTGQHIGQVAALDRQDVDAPWVFITCMPERI